MNATDWSLGYLQWRILWKPTKRLSSVVISNFPFLFYFIYLLLLLSTEFLYKNTITSVPISHHSYLTLSLPHQFLPSCSMSPFTTPSISLATFLLPATPPAPDIHSTRTVPLPPCRQLLLLHNPQNLRGKKTATSAFKFFLSSYMQHCNVTSCLIPNVDPHPTRRTNWFANILLPYIWTQIHLGPACTNQQVAPNDSGFPFHFTILALRIFGGLVIILEIQCTSGLRLVKSSRWIYTKMMKSFDMIYLTAIG